MDLPSLIGWSVDQLVIAHIWAISLWVLGRRFIPEFSWLPGLLPWINALLFLSSAAYLVMMTLTIAAFSADMHGSFVLSRWYVWLTWLFNLCGLTMLVPQWRRSWKWGLALAVLNSLLPWMPEWTTQALPDYLPATWTFSEVRWHTWLRNATLLAALIVAAHIWIQGRLSKVRTNNPN